MCDFSKQKDDNCAMKAKLCRNESTNTGACALLFVEKEALLHWQKQPCTFIQWKEIREFAGTGLGSVENNVLVQKE